jgi:CheY-like chemotaxis protein
MKVIIIENNEETIKAISEYFTSIDKPFIVRASDLVQGVNKIKNQKFDLVFVHLNMLKKHDSIDLSEVLKKSLDYDLSSTFLLTEDIKSDEFEQLIKKGFKSILTLPIDEISLNEKISLFLQSSSKK